MKKRKTFSQRLLALTLCLLCLLAAMPIAALAEGNAETTTEPVTQVTEAPAGDTSGDTTGTTGDTDPSAPPDPSESSEPSEPEASSEPSEPENSEPTETTATDETEDQVDPVQELYDRLMACTTLEQINAILDNLTEEENALLEQFTGEQNAALEAKMDGFHAYDTNVAANTGTSQRYYNGDNTVAYDVVIDGTAANDSTNTYVTSVKLGAGVVEQKNAQGNYGIQAQPVSYKNDKLSPEGYSAITIDKYIPGVEGQWVNYGYYPRVGEKLSTYYGTDVDATTNEKYVTLAVTPADGYYVTRIFITCGNSATNMVAATPLKCHVWESGKAYDRAFTLDTGRQVSVDLTSSWFGHYTDYPRDDENYKYSNYMSLSGLDQYFILIEVAPIPTPTYVEYDYGDIVSLGGDETIFNDADAWTSVGGSNNYGTTTAPDTQYTQYRYTYTEGNLSGASEWKHYANSVTETAKKNAANIGYRFAGWKAQYYTNCEASETGAKYNNNFKYTFSEEAMGTTYSYAENVAVPLFTHVRLVAQWEPIQLKMTKTVSGLNEIEDEGINKFQTYKLTLLRKNGDSWDEVVADVDYPITGDGTLTYTFGATAEDRAGAITPGTYRVVETGEYTINGQRKNAVCTKTYPVETVVVREDGTVQELKVLNSYEESDATATITVKKLISGNMLSKNDVFSFKVDGNIDEADKSFTLKHGESKNITVTLGDIITVTEETGSYTTTYQVGMNDPVPNNVAEIKVESDETIVFTNTHNITIDTGILLDTLPYILILAVVAVGAVVMLRKRRSRYED